MICWGLSGGDSTDASCLNERLEFFRFVDNFFNGRGDILDSTLSLLLNQTPRDCSFADAKKIPNKTQKSKLKLSKKCLPLNF